MSFAGRGWALLIALVTVTSITGHLGAQGLAAGSTVPNISPGPDGTGAISGTVVDAATGRPIAGAVVSLSIRPNNLVAAFVRQVSDPSGRFAFTRLPVHEGYTLGATKHGYFDGGYGREAPFASIRPLALADAQWIGDVTIRLARPASVSGTLVDEVSEPIVGAFVQVLASTSIGGETRWVSGPAAVTDDRGAYRIANLLPGSYLVVAPSVQTTVPAEISLAALSNTSESSIALQESQGRAVSFRRDPAIAQDGHRLIVTGANPPPPSVNGRPQAYPATFHPGVRSIDLAQPISLTPGEQRVGVHLQARPLATGRVSGRIEGPAEAWSGLVLRLVTPAGEFIGNGGEAATTVVGSGGDFTFLNVPAGSYTLVASRSSAGYAFTPGTLTGAAHLPSPPGEVISGMTIFTLLETPHIAMTVTTAGSHSAYGARMPVEVGDADVTGLIVRLTRGVSVQGRIVAEGTDPAAEPASIAVRAEPVGGDPGRVTANGRTTRGDRERTFSINGLHPGEYFIRPGGDVVKSILWNGRDYSRRPMEIGGAEDITGVVITTSAAPARVAGTVRDGQGRPAGTATVICFPVERDQWQRYGLQSDRLRSIKSASSGAFRSPVLPAGDYYVVAIADSATRAWTSTAFLEAAARSATRLTVGWGETKTIDLTIVEVK